MPAPYSQVPVLPRRVMLRTNEDLRTDGSCRWHARTVWNPEVLSVGDAFHFITEVWLIAVL